MHRSQGFPNGVDWWVGGGQFVENREKLHENDKIGIFGSKQWGGGHVRGWVGEIPHVVGEIPWVNFCDIGLSWFIIYLNL